jgi:CRP/FNR family transcriptional regulator, cyclic AMP receptor protein
MALGSNAKTELIKSVPLFEHCSRRDLAKIARITDELDIPEDKVLITEGERGREFFVVVRGEVEVRRKGKKLATLGPGTFFGEIALLSNKPRTATVMALTPLRVLVIVDRAFVELLDTMPDLWLKVARSLAERVTPDDLSE